MDFLSSLADTFGAPQPYEGQDALLCPGCNWSNPPTARTCQSCDKPLEQGEPIPEFYVPLFRATQALAAEEIEPEEWMEIWQHLGASLQNMAAQIEHQIFRMTSVLGQRPEAASASQLLRQGLEDSLDSLDRMGQFLEDDDPTSLLEGWDGLLAASKVIQKAMQQFQALRQQLSTASESED